MFQMRPNAEILSSQFQAWWTESQILWPSIRALKVFDWKVEIEPDRAQSRAFGRDILPDVLVINLKLYLCCEKLHTVFYILKIQSM